MQLVPPGKREEEGSTSSSSFYPFSPVPPFHPGRLCLARSPFAAAAAPLPSPPLRRLSSARGSPPPVRGRVCDGDGGGRRALQTSPQKKKRRRRRGTSLRGKEAGRTGRTRGWDSPRSLQPAPAAKEGERWLALPREEEDANQVCKNFVGDTRGGGKRKGGRRSRRTRLQRYSSPRLSVLFTFYFICFFFVAVTLHKSGVHLISLLKNTSWGKLIRSSFLKISAANLLPLSRCLKPKDSQQSI